MQDILVSETVEKANKLTRREVYDAVVSAFEKKYTWLGRQFAEEALLSLSSWNIQNFNSPSYKGERDDEMHWVRKAPEYRARKHLLLFWQPGFIKCLGENEKVLIGDKYIPIKDLPETGYLTTLENGKAIEAQFFKSPIKKESCFELTTIGNTNIVAGQDHPFLIISKEGNIEWIKTKDIKENDVIIMANPDVSSEVIDDDAEELARLTGYLIGDGFYNHKNKFGFTNQNKKILDDYEYLIKKHITEKPLAKYSKGNTFDYSMHSQEARKILEKKCGLKLNQKSANKEIPERFMTPNKRIIQNVLFGLYQTDGGYAENGIYFSSISKKLLNQVKELLLYCGIHSKNYTVCGNNFCLHVTGSTNLSKLSMLLNSKHKEKIQKIIARRNSASETIPFASKIILNQLAKRVGKGYSNSIRKQFKEVGLQRNNFYGKESKNKYYFKKAIDLFKLPELEWLILESISFERVKSNIKIGVKPCYDLYVPRTNTFISNGFLTHNSSLLLKLREILGSEMCGSITDVTTAAIRGSVESGRFKAPVCLKHPYTVCSEFGQLINSSSDSSELVQKLLNILEEGKVNVSLIKVAQLLESERERAINTYGVKFDDDNNFEYTTNWVLMAGTYNKKFLKDNALESRFNIMMPERKFDASFTRYICSAPPFDLADEYKIALRNLLLDDTPMDTKVVLPLEVHEAGLTMRDLSNLQSRVICLRWWGVEMLDSEIIKYAYKMKENQKIAWESEEDKIFNCLFMTPKTLEEVAKETNLPIRQVFMAIKRNFGASQVLEDTKYKYVIN